VGGQAAERRQRDSREQLDRYELPAFAVKSLGGSQRLDRCRTTLLRRSLTEGWIIPGAHAAGLGSYAAPRLEPSFFAQVQRMRCEWAQDNGVTVRVNRVCRDGLRAPATGHLVDYY
jgi:hypothetical protein